MAFIYVPMAAALLCRFGLKVLRDRHLWANFLIAAVAVMAPFAILAMKFTATGAYGSIHDPGAPTGVASWLYYLTRLPESVGWPIAGLSATFLFGSAALGWQAFRSDERLLLGAWVVVGYSVFTALVHKEARYDLVFLYPVVLVASLGASRLFGDRLGTIVCLCVGVFYLGRAAVAHIPEYRGYKEAAAVVAHEAPRNSVVLYFGDRDANFIFNIRREGRRDLVILRADKLLLRYSMIRSRGLSEVITDPSQISALLNRDGVRLAVVQEGFWTDLKSIRALAEVLHSPQFRPVGKIGLTTNFSDWHSDLLIVRNEAAVATGPIELELRSGPLGRTLTGTSR